MNETSFTIVLPVRNGGSYIKLCVESILAQTFVDFELLILENFSTDETNNYLSGITDSRVKIYPAATPLSIEENWHRITEIPKKEFMTIIGHDDLLDTNYVEVMNNLIKNNPEAQLYQTHFRLINATGKLIRKCKPMPERETAAQFLAARLSFSRDSFGTGYMMRSEVYDRIGGIPSYPKLLFADDALWLKLMQSSSKITAKDECFSYRYHAESTSGNPSANSFLNALEQYVLFLEDLSQKDESIANTMKKYAPKGVLKWCQIFYRLSQKQPDHLPFNDEIEKINIILEKSYCDYRYNRLLMDWVYKTPLKIYSRYLFYINYQFRERLVDKIFIILYLSPRIIREFLKQLWQFLKAALFINGL